MVSRDLGNRTCGVIAACAAMGMTSRSSSLLEACVERPSRGCPNDCRSILQPSPVAMLWALLAPDPRRLAMQVLSTVTIRGLCADALPISGPGEVRTSQG